LHCFSESKDFTGVAFNTPFGLHYNLELMDFAGEGLAGGTNETVEKEVLAPVTQDTAHARRDDQP